MIMSLGNTNFNASYIRCWDREKRLSGFNHSLKSEHIQKNSGFTAPDAFRAQDSCPDTFADSK